MLWGLVARSSSLVSFTEGASNKHRPLTRLVRKRHADWLVSIQCSCLLGTFCVAWNAPFFKRENLLSLSTGNLVWASKSHAYIEMKYVRMTWPYIARSTSNKVTVILVRDSLSTVLYIHALFGIRISHQRCHEERYSGYLSLGDIFCGDMTPTKQTRLWKICERSTSRAERKEERSLKETVFLFG